jgi:hypothetical protein
MTRGQKTVSVLALLALFWLGTGFGGEPTTPGQIKRPPKPTTPCPDGQHWEFDVATWSWNCVAGPPSTEPCPDGFVRDANGDCVPAVVVPPPVDEPDVIEVPDGPIDDPNDYIKPYPTGGNFYQVVHGDYAYGEDATHSIVFRYLWTEAFLAAKQFGGKTDAEANTFAGNVARDNDLRVEAWTTIIGCSGANDLAYATWGYNPNNDPDPAYTGRVIRLVPQHPDNRARLLNGQGLARCIRLGTQATKGNGNGVRVGPSGECYSYELLWLPQLNREALWESGGATLKTEDGETWSDGTSRGLPPPFVTDRKFYAYPGSIPDPTPKIWGCFALTLELE